MIEKVDIAIVGATGTVGEAMIDILADSDIPVGNLYLLGSENSAGKRLDFKGKKIRVENLEDFDFAKAQIALFAADIAVSEEYVPKAAGTGCIVIDRTSCFRFDDEVPLVVPEVNPEAIGQYIKRNIIANPCCGTIQMLVALKPIHDAVGISRINVATYQAVSGAGKQGIEELGKQTARLLNLKPLENEVFPAQIAFNVIPQIDQFEENGYTREEMKMVWETRKILGDDDIMVNPTAVRVPVFFGHSEAVHIETVDKINAVQARKLLGSAPGVEVVDTQEPGGYPTPVTDAVGSDWVYVGRIREDISHPKGLNLWIVSDNVRKGAALNSIQIAQILVKEYL
jgi:aspartate-semialdehyde dehydrogenase